MGLLAAVAGPVQAVVVSRIDVGTWTTAPVGPNPGQLAQGGKFVIKSTYDTVNIGAVTEADRFIGGGSGGVLDPTRVFRAQLSGTPPDGDFELHVPIEGFNTVSVQTGADHFPIGPGFAPKAEIQFFDATGTQFRGYEFESDFLPGTTSLPGGGLIFETFTADVDFGGTRVTNSSAQMINGNNAFGLDITSSTVDVRSEDAGPSGGQQNPGVFLSGAVPVVADADRGSNPNALSYSAASLVLTTDASTALVTDTVDPIVPGQVRTAPSALDAQPRQADNDLGAARSDGEDFLTYEWTVDGTPAGQGTLSGQRLDREVQTGAGGPRFVNLGDRTVDDVNISVAIQDSGLANTTDSATWDVQVTEDITGFSDTDSLTVTYNNTGPNATAGGDVVFNAANFSTGASTSGASADDADLAVNSAIAGFEQITADFQIGGVSLPGDPATIASSTPVNPQSRTITLAQSGLTTTIDTNTLDLTVTDFAGASDADSATIRYENAAPVANASATAVGPGGVDLDFALLLDDADLDVNSLILGFEELLVEILVDSLVESAFFNELITTGSQLVSNSALQSQFGLGPHTFEVSVTDRAGAIGTDTFQFEVLQPVQQVPAPAPLWLIGVGLLGLGAARRRRLAG